MDNVTVSTFYTHSESIRSATELTLTTFYWHDYWHEYKSLEKLPSCFETFIFCHEEKDINVIKEHYPNRKTFCLNIDWFKNNYCKSLHTYRNFDDVENIDVKICGADWDRENNVLNYYDPACETLKTTMRKCLEKQFDPMWTGLEDEYPVFLTKFVAKRLFEKRIDLELKIKVVIVFKNGLKEKHEYVLNFPFGHR